MFLRKGHVVVMSVAQAPQSVQAQGQQESVSVYTRRLLLLSLLLCISLGLTLLHLLMPTRSELIPVIPIWLASFVPYLAACWVVLRGKPAVGRWQWIELGIILGGALLLRAVLLGTVPNLSSDAWRYLWDARITLHGFSPYVYVPDDKLLVPFHDKLVYGHMVYHDVPTIYPPAAQAVYLLSYLVAPNNLSVLKGIFMVFDLVSCCALALLLKRRGLNPSRTLLYAWSPLPIVEFAIQGHVDVLAITFMLLAMLSALSQRRGARTLTGFLLGLATLAKIYPVLLLVVVLRRKDYALLATFVGTVLVGYAPYLILGHGQVLGFFSVYANQHGANGGVLPLVLVWFARVVFSYRDLIPTFFVEHCLDVLLVVTVPLFLLILRWRERISMEGAILVLIGLVFAISSHVFPWYTAALLPWVAVLVGPLWRRQAGGRVEFSEKQLAVVAVWYFVCASLFSYVAAVINDWRFYYLLVYGVLCVALASAVVLRSVRARREGVAS